MLTNCEGYGRPYPLMHRRRTRRQAPLRPSLPRHRWRHRRLSMTSRYEVGTDADDGIIGRPHCAECVCTDGSLSRVDTNASGGHAQQERNEMTRAHHDVLLFRVAINCDGLCAEGWSKQVRECDMARGTVQLVEGRSNLRHDVQSSNYTCSGLPLRYMCSVI